MSRLVFLLEERSMKILLDGLLPRLFPDLPFLSVPHEGKQDQAFADDGLRGIERKARYRDPDAVVRPSAEVERLVPEFQKISGARRMALRLSRERNRSKSFHVTIGGIEREAAALQRSPGPDSPESVDGDN